MDQRLALGACAPQIAPLGPPPPPNQPSQTPAPQATAPWPHHGMITIMMGGVASAFEPRIRLRQGLPSVLNPVVLTQNGSSVQQADPTLSAQKVPILGLKRCHAMGAPVPHYAYSVLRFPALDVGLKSDTTAA